MSHRVSFDPEAADSGQHRHNRKRFINRFVPYLLLGAAAVQGAAAALYVILEIAKVIPWR